ncbi:MAG: RNA-binding protein [Bacteroidales bacterium]|nr:RNA-binding protein [Bacteroidales bacterium]
MNIYVGNLNYKVNAERLKTVFLEYGEVESAIVITDKFTGRSKGFGFVTMVSDSDAQRAIDELNGKEFEGRQMVVNQARPKEESR